MKTFSSLGRSVAALLLLATAPLAAQAQTGSVGIGTTAPDASAALDIVSSSKGLLLPRVAAATGIASPAPGLLVYQTGSPAGFYYNSGTAAAPSWRQLNVVGGAGDNLGNHTATQNLNLQGNALVGTGADLGTRVGVGVRADGGLNLGQNTAGNNVLLGYQAGQAITTGGSNLFLGYNSGSSNTTGGNNLFIGYQSGFFNTTGSQNQYSGVQSGFFNTTGSQNLFSGYLSGTFNTSGSRNQFGGYGSGYNNTTGTNNLFSGYQSGYYNITGSNNTALGYGSGPANGSGALTNATALGANVVLTTSNTVILGNGANVGIGTPSPGQKLEVAGGIKFTGTGNALTFPDGTAQTTAAAPANLTGDVTSVGAATTYANVVPAAKGGAGTVNGLLKADGSGRVSAAVAGTDYLTPAWVGTGFIQNTTTQQAGSNFNISGAGTVGGLLTAGSTTVSGSATVAGQVGIGTTAPSQALDVRGNLRLGDDGGNSATGLGQALEFVGPGFNTDPVGLYRTNPASDASELRVVVGDASDANDKFVVGRSSATAEGGLATGTFTPSFTVQGNGSVGIGTTAPDASAALDIVSSSKGVLLPRVVAVGTIASPAPGLLVYQTGTPAGFYYNSGTAAAPNWRQLNVVGGAGDNLGNHTATQNLNLQGNALVGTGADLGTRVGVGVRADGGLNLGQNTAGNNVLLGYQAGQTTTGTRNQFLGYQSGAANTTGSSNQFLGFQSGNRNTTGTTNQFLGYQSGFSNTTGRQNQFGGYQSGYSNTTGSYNQFDGYWSGYNTTTGTYNLFSGLQSGYSNTTGSNNQFLGYGSGYYNTTGSNNTAVGYGSGPAQGSGALTNATALGSNVELTNSSTVILGNGANVGIGTTNPGQKLEVTGQIFSNAGGFRFPDNTVQTTAASGAGFIQNQTSADQAAGFRVSGNGYVAGQVAIGTTSPAASAALDVSSTTQGLLPPRMTQAQRDAIASPAPGLTLYNTATGKLNVWNGTRWTEPLTTSEQPYQNATATFAYSGAAQTYTVPADVYSLTVVARGAGGGTARNVNASASGGKGGQATATLRVTPGEVLTVQVGGAGGFSGAPGYNGGGTGYDDGNSGGGGGGGGATDVRRGTTLANRLLVAAGGGGGCNAGTTGSGGSGGQPAGTAGSNAGATSTTNSGGGGGTQTAGGTGGGGNSALAGTLGQGGSTTAYLSGGGGGGYYGGGAGGGAGGAGGGGSSWATPTGSSAVAFVNNTNSADGSVSITPGLAYAAPVLDGSNISNVPGTWDVNGSSLYHNDGNVGVGTSSPGHPLTVQANSGGAMLGFNTSAGTDKYNFSLSGGGLNLSESNVAGGRLFVQDGGNVGIGTTSPSQKLDVSGSTNVTGTSTVGGNSTVGGSATVAGSVGIGLTTATQALDVNGGILARASSAISTQGAYLQWNRSGGSGETWLLNQQGGGAGGIYFGKATTTNTVTEWARFDSNGNLGIGTTSVGQKLTVNGAICASLGLNCASDARYKREVTEVQGALASVMRLRGVTYYWKQAEFPAKQFPARRQLGFIAQEIEPYYPEMVTTDADGYKSVDYSRLTPVLVEALKEQQQQIEALKARAATAETKAAQATATLETFEARLRRLEAAGGQAQR